MSDFVNFFDDYETSHKGAGPRGVAPRGVGRPRDGTAPDGWLGQEEVNRRLGEDVETTVPSSLRPEFDPEEYRFEKIIGTRLPGGEKPLKRLNVKHRNVIALHLRGLSARDIRDITGLCERSVYKIINDPLSQDIVRHYIEGIDAELEALAPLAVGAVRDGLNEKQDPRVRLLAADRFFKATGRYVQAEQKRESAEDVLARALARVAAERDRGGAHLRELRRSAPVDALSRPRQSILIEGHAEEIDASNT